MTSSPRPSSRSTRDGSVPVELWIDDVGVEFVDLSLLGRDPADVAFRPLFRDNFDRYESALFPRQGGWRSMQTEVRGKAAEEGAEMLRAAREEEEAASGVDDRIYASSAKSFKLEGSDEEPGRATKRFSLPERVPYCVSAEPFAIIVTGEATPEQKRADPSRDREMESRRQKRWDFEKEGRTRRPAGRSGPASSKPAAGPVRSGSSEGMEEAKLMSGVPVSGAFYIYAFDGRLLAEYDVAGALVRDYIYFGGQLVAEYTGAQLFYYASDQINSTRIVTDSSGTVVYAAAHEPYGGIQKTWVTTYDPALKFSGKQRDAESDLDYFGARYYDRAQYRFISTDPICRKSSGNLQMANLYSYCINNPINLIDPNGEDLVGINLPFDKDRIVHLYLERAFATRVEGFFAACASNGINILLTDAFRTKAEHNDYQEDPTMNAAAGWSRHCIGWAIDINWAALSSTEQAIVLSCAQAAGLSWVAWATRCISLRRLHLPLILSLSVLKKPIFYTKNGILVSIFGRIQEGMI